MALPLPTLQNHGGRALLGAVLISGLVARAAKAEIVPPMPRVRTADAPIAAMIHEATESSATFRRLVDTIDASDGIVYIDRGNCGQGFRACLSLSVTMAGPNRVLRIVIDPRKWNRDVMGSLGHELQHAVEMLSDRAVTSTAAAYFFYDRTTGSARAWGSIKFETDAAIRAGFDVRAEIEAHLREAR